MLRLQYNPTLHTWVVSEDSRLGFEDESLNVVNENLELLEESPERNYSTPIRIQMR